jgi:hypothetical protein
MDSFYSIVLIISVVLLIIVLTASAVSLQAVDEKEIFPKIESKCPDGWVFKDNKCYYKDTRSGGTFHTSNVPNTSSIPVDTKIVTAVENDDAFKSITFNSNASTCNKKTWAIDFNIKWDGVTNYNNCV